MTLAEWRARLLRVTHATLEAGGRTGASRWTRTGSGRIVAAVTGPAAIEWEEAGEWTEGAASFGYRTRLRWEIRDDEIHLSHLRRGTDAPVLLATLRLNEHGALIPGAPHLCGDDQYLADIRLQDGALVLAWRATGPAKDYRLVMTYR